jgi:hypothetical protein
LDLLLKKLLQSSKSGIELLLAIAGTVVEILTTAVAESLTILLAQQLGIQIQDENCPYNVIQIGAVSLQREYPFVFVLFVGQLCHQNHIDRDQNVPVEAAGAAVADAVDAGSDRTGHHHNTGGVPHGTLSHNGLGHRLADAIAKIT